jgi:hypothetical protein
MKKIIVSVLASCSTLFAYAQTELPDSSKRSYSLFHPTPRTKMREFQTDRPDVTESAYTVDAGHFQVESDAYRLTFNKENGVRTSESTFNLANLKIGLSNSTDLQLVLPFYVEEITKINGIHTDTKRSGFNDFTLRLKKNLWGNDEGKTALAVMPFVNAQTGNDVEGRRLEGGVVVPFNLELSDSWSFGAQGQFSLLRNQDRKYDKELLNSVTVGKDLSNTTSAFVESHYTYNFSEKQFEIFLNGGVSYSITDNFKLDLGLNYGLKKGTDRVYFIGYSFRY